MRYSPSVLVRVSREQSIVNCGSQLDQRSTNNFGETFLVADFVEKLIIGHDDEISRR